LIFKTRRKLLSTLILQKPTPTTIFNPAKKKRPVGARRKGRPGKRWIKSVEGDLKRMTLESYIDLFFRAIK
jgi:hypothetical protein